MQDAGKSRKLPIPKAVHTKVIERSVHDRVVYVLTIGPRFWKPIALILLGVSGPDILEDGGEVLLQHLQYSCRTPVCDLSCSEEAGASLIASERVSIESVDSTLCRAEDYCP